MKTATVDDLRAQLPSLLNAVEGGETVEVTRGGKVVARLVPAAPQWPDFAARLKQTYPQGVPGVPASSLVDEGRGERP